MDKRKDAERVRLERARQEDAALNRVLIIIVGAVVLEAILFLLNRFYVSYTIDDIARVQAILAAVKVLLVAFPICFVGSLVWLLAARKNGRRMLLPGICTGSFAALSICAVAARFFRESGIPALCVLVPALAALGLVYYLYQREFFVVAAASAGGLLGVWLIRRGTGRLVLYPYLILAALALVAAVVLAVMLQKNQGVLKRDGRDVQILPRNANYVMIYVTCALVAAVLIAALAVGGQVILYAALVAWLLIMAVYYTVKLM